MNKQDKEDDLLEDDTYERTNQLWISPSQIRKQNEANKAFKESHNNISKLDFCLCSIDPNLVTEATYSRYQSFKENRCADNE